MTDKTYTKAAQAAADSSQPKAQTGAPPAISSETTDAEPLEERGTSFIAPVYVDSFALLPDALSTFAAKQNITGIEFGVLLAMMSLGVTLAGEMEKSSVKMIVKALGHALTCEQVERARRRLLSKGVIEPLNRVTTDGTIIVDRPNKKHVASYRIASEIWESVELSNRDKYDSNNKNMKLQRGGVLITGTVKVTRYVSGSYTAVPLKLAEEMVARKLGARATHVLMLILKALNADGCAWSEPVGYYRTLPIDGRRLHDGVKELLRDTKDFKALIIMEAINGETYYRIAPDVWKKIKLKREAPKVKLQEESDDWCSDPIYQSRLVTL